MPQCAVADTATAGAATALRAADGWLIQDSSANGRPSELHSEDLGSTPSEFTTPRSFNGRTPVFGAQLEHQVDMCYCEHMDDRVCTKCNQAKPLESFSNKTGDRKQAYCKPCQSDYFKAYYKGQGESGRKRIIERRRQRIDNATAWLNALKSAPCMDCGGSFHPVAMDFDHRDGTGKAFAISTGRGLVSKSRLESEISKCDIVCANCHRVRTHNRRSMVVRVHRAEPSPA